MKFKEIKVGDTILTKKVITVGWRINKIFYIPSKVVKVTATQFVDEAGNHYKKENGLKIGGGYGENAHLGGEKVREYGVDSTYTDQTKEYNEMLLKRKNANTICDIHEELGTLLEVQNIVELSNSDIELMEDHLKAVKEIMAKAK